MKQNNVQRLLITGGGLGLCFGGIADAWPASDGVVLGAATVGFLCGAGLSMYGIWRRASGVTKHQE